MTPHRKVTPRFHHVGLDALTGACSLVRSLFSCIFWVPPSSHKGSYRNLHPLVSSHFMRTRHPPSTRLPFQAVLTLGFRPAVSLRLDSSPAQYIQHPLNLIKHDTTEAIIPRAFGSRTAWFATARHTAWHPGYLKFQRVEASSIASEFRFGDT